MIVFLMLISIVQWSAALTKIEISSAAGPCMLNDDGLKCTKKGYYETVQCDARGCFCVSANTGLTAFDTRTSNNKTLPKCSECHNALKKLFADGNVRQGTFVPKCNVILGDYELLQCDAKREWCYCADAKTGREAPNSRKGTGENKYIICGSTNNSIDPNELFYADAILQQRERYAVASPTCKLDRSKGVACPGQGAKPSVRYYFDYNTASCLAFEYLGCGGNANNYRTSSDCFSNCLFVDQSGCAGMYPSARLSNGNSIICPQLMLLPPGVKPATTIVGPKLNKEDCPLDHSCRMGAFFGTCCPQANEDRFDAAYNGKCSNGREPYSIPKDGWREVLRGKTCKDNFCPTGYKCQDADVFAICC